MARRRKPFYRKKPIGIRETKSQVGFLLCILGVFVFIMFYEQYKWYALAMAILIIVLGFIIYKFFAYRRNQRLFHNRTYDELTIMDPFDFEHLCGQIVTLLGFYNVQITQSRRDGGIDIWCYKNNKKYAIQCKRYTGTNFVTVEEMRALYGSAHPKGAAPIMMTTGKCSGDSMQYARTNNIQVRDHLIFKNKFVELLERTPSFMEWFSRNLI